MTAQRLRKACWLGTSSKPRTQARFRLPQANLQIYIRRRPGTFKSPQQLPCHTKIRGRCPSQIPTVLTCHSCSSCAQVVNHITTDATIYNGFQGSRVQTYELTVCSALIMGPTGSNKVVSGIIHPPCRTVRSLLYNQTLKMTIHWPKLPLWDTQIDALTTTSLAVMAHAICDVTSHKNVRNVNQRLKRGWTGKKSCTKSEYAYEVVWSLLLN